MNPMRRAVARAAVSASRVTSNKQSMLRVATQVAVGRAAAPAAVRFFSQTLRVANEDAFNTLQSEATNTEASPTPTATAEETGFGLFIRNMVFEANEDHLREAYEKYGEVTKAAVARDARGLSRGYGFVWFTTKEAMESAVAGTNASFWHGRRIQVSPRAPRTQERGSRGISPTKSLYVGNIPYETTDAELNRIFRELDNVVDVRVAVDRTTGWPRGFAHADFSDVESCTEGMNKLRGTTIGGRELRLDYASEMVKKEN